jgi:hypothetical protein
MDKKKEQKIVVFTSLTPNDKNLILTGVRLASIFKKELSLVYRISKKESENQPVIQQKLLEYIHPLKKEIPTLKTSVLLPENQLRMLPRVLADDIEAILFIAESTHYKKYSKAITDSPVPFLFVNPKAPLSSFKSIVLPIDLRRGNSDSTLWCSWFGRFNPSEITVVAANDKSRNSQQQVTQNVILAKKLFGQFRIAHKIYKGEKGSFQNSFEALEYALKSKSDMFVLPGSSVITPLDRIIGLPEGKIIKNAQHLPVLLINPRRDNYILCD